MPRNVRNFWISLDVDGRHSLVATGPRAKTSGFSLTIQQRDQGDVVRALDVTGAADDNGDLILRVFDGQGNCRHTFTTKR